MSMTFITRHPFTDVSRIKDEAKRLARKEKIPHHDALDIVTERTLHGAKWADIQDQVATLRDECEIMTRLEDNGPVLELVLYGFAEDLSDFNGRAALYGLTLRCASISDQYPEDGFRIILEAHKVLDSYPSEFSRLPLGNWIEPEDAEAPLRVRLAPVVEFLRSYTDNQLRKAIHLDAESLAGAIDMEAQEIALEGEEAIQEALRLHGPGAATWAAKAYLTQTPWMPRAYLALALQAKDSEARSRFIDLGTYAAETLYGEAAEELVVIDEATLQALESLISLHVLRAAEIETRGEHDEARARRKIVADLLAQDWMGNVELTREDRTGLEFSEPVRAAMGALPD